MSTSSIARVVTPIQNQKNTLILNFPVNCEIKILIEILLDNSITCLFSSARKIISEYLPIKLPPVWKSHAGWSFCFLVFGIFFKLKPLKQNVTGSINISWKERIHATKPLQKLNYLYGLCLNTSHNEFPESNSSHSKTKMGFKSETKLNLRERQSPHASK